MAATISDVLSRPAPQPSDAFIQKPILRQTSTVTVLLTTFAGLGLPRTLSLPVSPRAPICHVLETIYNRLPRLDHPLLVTTTSNKQLLNTSTDPVATLLSDSEDTFLPLRLSARLCGGKGGFGSQLRAAGGRMSSRKNHNQQEANPNGSNRNLDGRRLRTVDEAKRLADYLAIKPEMAQKEKEERKKRWEAVVEAAEKREADIKSGKVGIMQGRLDAEYVESKEEAEERTRAAVMKAMREGFKDDERTGSESSVDMEGSDDEQHAESSGSSDDARPGVKVDTGRTFFGWDGDDDDLSEDEEVEELAFSGEMATYDGKGKGRVQ